jgi:hypothetical protein
VPEHDFRHWRYRTLHSLTGKAKPKAAMDLKKLSDGERLALSQICWPETRVAASEIEQDLHRLGAKRLASRNPDGTWVPTARGRFLLACLAIGITPPD